MSDLLKHLSIIMALQTATTTQQQQQHDDNNNSSSSLVAAQACNINWSSVLEMN